MKQVIFPATVGVLVLASWVAVALIDQCMLQNADPKFGCWDGVRITAVFAAIGAVQTALLAGLVRACLRSFLSFESVGPECIAAVLSGIVLVLLFDGIIRWELDIGGMAGMFVGWLLASVLICGTALVVVQRFIKRA